MLEKWHELIFDRYNIGTVLDAVKDEDWQRTRRSMLGTTADFKYVTLVNWLDKKDYSDRSKCQVTNYVHALKRGGILKV